MKDLLITHLDLDGISPIILMNLINANFEYRSIEIAELDEVFDELKATFPNYRHVYFTDLTLKPEMYDYIIENELTNVLVFDHHATHLFANDYDFVNVVIDYDGIQTCGTEIFYKYLLKDHKELDKPNIKEYVDQVRELDTFTFTSDLPRDIESIRSTIGRENFIKSITKRLKKDKEHFELTSFEKRFVKLKKEELQRYMQKKEKTMLTCMIDGHKVGVSFAETNKSELGNYLANNHPDLEFIILIDASSRISYRASRDDADVAKFAEIYEGGGHKKASGSKFEDDQRIAILNNYFKEVKKLDFEENI